MTDEQIIAIMTSEGHSAFHYARLYIELVHSGYFHERQDIRHALGIRADMTDREVNARYEEERIKFLNEFHQ